MFFCLWGKGFASVQLTFIPSGVRWDKPEKMPFFESYVYDAQNFSVLPPINLPPILPFTSTVTLLLFTTLYVSNTPLYATSIPNIQTQTRKSKKNRRNRTTTLSNSVGNTQAISFGLTQDKIKPFGLTQEVFSTDINSENFSGSIFTGQFYGLSRQDIGTSSDYTVQGITEFPLFLHPAEMESNKPEYKESTFILLVSIFILLTFLSLCFAVHFCYVCVIRRYIPRVRKNCHDSYEMSLLPSVADYVNTEFHSEMSMRDGHVDVDVPLMSGSLNDIVNDSASRDDVSNVNIPLGEIV
jgi:hypothetical protein